MAATWPSQRFRMEKARGVPPGQRPMPRNISRAGIGRGHYHRDALLVLNGALRARAATRSCGSKNSKPRRIYNKSVLVSQPYLDRARNGVAPPVMAYAFLWLVRLNGR